MAVLVECPGCKTRNAIKRVYCTKCKAALPKTNRAYWVVGYIRDGEKRLKRKKRLGHVFLAEAKAEDAVWLRGEGGRPAPVAFRDIYERYLSSLERRGASIKCQRVYAQRFLALWGDLDALAITPGMIEDFRAGMMSGVYGKPQSPAYIDRHIQALRAAYNYSGIEPNPVKGKQLFRPDNRLFVTLTEDEIHRLLLAAREVAPGLYDPLVVTLNTGLRWSNVFRLRWDQVDLGAGLIRIVQKGQRNHAVAMNATVRNIFAHKQADTEYVFINPRTNRPYVWTQRAWARIKARAGITKPLRWHDLRHVYATMVYRASGANHQVVQEILGHSQLSTTLRYMNLPTNVVRQAVDSISVSLPE